MDVVYLILGLLVCATALAMVARQLKVPFPVVLVFGGLALGFVPNIPAVRVNPDFALALILPPILYQAAIFTSWREYQANLSTIMLLAIGLVIVTMVAVAAAARWLIPDLPWAAAFVLGAIVSPPDAVAATSILNRLRMPRRIVAVLEGESLVNDATGLVAYKFAVAAVLTGTFSLVEASGNFVLVGAGGIVVGLVLGWLFVRMHQYVRDPMLEIAVSLLLPFVAYLAAETVHVSGVLSVVAAGLLRGWHAPEVFSPQARLQGYMVWGVIVFLLNSAVFIMIGLELSDVLDRLRGASGPRLLVHAAIISLVTIAVRFAWIIPAVYLPRMVSRRLRVVDPVPPWSHIVITSWCGMRGIVSLAAALALPYTIYGGGGFPGRDHILFLSFSVIFVTLVLQGMTLAPLIRWLGVGADAEVDEEERQARVKTAYAAIAELDRMSASATFDGAVLRGVRVEYQGRINDWEAVRAKRAAGDATGTTELRRAVRLQVIAAERRRLIKLRRDRVIGDEVLHRIQRELDLEEIRLS